MQQGASTCIVFPQQVPPTSPLTNDMIQHMFCEHEQPTSALIMHTPCAVRVITGAFLNVHHTFVTQIIKE